MSRWPARIATLLGVAVLVSGCSAGSDGSRPDDSPAPGRVERDVVGSFDKLKVADGFQVQVARGAESRVTVSATGIPEEQIEVAVDQNTLKLSTKTGPVPRGAVLSAAVVVPSLIEVTATSGAQVDLLSGLAIGAPSGPTVGGHDATVDLTAGAGFDGEVSAESFSIFLQAGARAQIRGSAGKASINGSEAGVLEGLEFDVADAQVTLSSGATTELTVHGTLDASLSSGSRLVYAGNPRITNRAVGTGATLQSTSS